MKKKFIVSQRAFSISQACTDFKPIFLQYIKTGELPENFASQAELKSYFNAFTEYERESIKNTCTQNLLPEDDFHNIKPVCKVLPKAAAEVITAIALSAAITYQYTHDISATLKNSARAAGAGVLWAYGRCCNAQAAAKIALAISESRVKEFLPTFCITPSKSYYS